MPLCLSPATIGGTGCRIQIDGADVDTFVKRASAGAKVLMERGNLFYGDRSPQLEDPSGHYWRLSTRIEDLSQEEMIKKERSCSAATSDD